MKDYKQQKKYFRVFTGVFLVWVFGFFLGGGGGYGGQVLET